MEYRRWEHMFNNCPFCGNELFLVGPSGGLATNFSCMECEAAFNDLGPCGIDLISGPKILIEVVEK